MVRRGLWPRQCAEYPRSGGYIDTAERDAFDDHMQPVLARLGDVTALRRSDEMEAGLAHLLAEDQGRKAAFIASAATTGATSRWANRQGRHPHKTCRARPGRACLRWADLQPRPTAWGAPLRTIGPVLAKAGSGRKNLARNTRHPVRLRRPAPCPARSGRRRHARGANPAVTGRSGRRPCCQTSRQADSRDLRAVKRGKIEMPLRPDARQARRLHRG